MPYKKLIRISAAGAGKTYQICHEAISEANEKRALLVTYTNKGVQSIKHELAKMNDGVLPAKVDVLSWYQFLLREMIKPYQTIYYKINQIRSIDFSEYSGINFRSGNSRFINDHSDVLSNEASKLALKINQDTKGLSIKRLADIYSHIFFDEFQDLSGYDLNLIEAFIDYPDISITMVGDGKQATFSTNRNSKNKKFQKNNIWRFFYDGYRNGRITIERNPASRRFNSEICDFANKVYSDSNPITTSMSETTNHDGVYFIKKEDIEKYCAIFQPVILRYDQRTDTMGWRAINYGECKGMTFDRSLIFPNQTFLKFLNKGIPLKAPEKYYVAVTRARYSICFVVEEIPRYMKSKKEKIMGMDVWHVYF